MRRFRWIAALLGSLGLIALRAGTAAACEPMPCQRGWVVPESGTIPENAAGLLVFVDRMSPRTNALANLSLRRDGQPEAASAKARPGAESRWSAYDILPDAGLRAGSKLELDIANPCSMLQPSRLTASVTVGPKAPPIVALGKLRIWSARRSTLEVSTSSGSCSQRAEAVWVDLEAQLDASAKPWAGLLEWQTFVDGARWTPTSAIGIAPPPGGSWAGRGRDRVYALCEDAGGDPGLGEGKHSVVMRATLAGGAELSTAAVKVSLDCAMARSTPEEGTETLEDPEQQPPPTPAAPAPPTAKRCGCEAPGAQSRLGSAGALMIAALALGGWRRVTARSRSTSARRR